MHQPSVPAVLLIGYVNGFIWTLIKKRCFIEISVQGGWTQQWREHRPYTAAHGVTPCMYYQSVGTTCAPQKNFLSNLYVIVPLDNYFFLFPYSALIGYESNNKYEIKNSMGQRVYFAAEQNDCCTRNFCGAARSFAITIVDNSGREIIRLVRPYRCSACCFPCCLQKVSIKGCSC